MQPMNEAAVRRDLEALLATWHSSTVRSEACVLEYTLVI